MIKKIDHVAIVVKDMKKAVKNYTEMFGFKEVSKMELPGGEFTSVMIASGDIHIELFQPLKKGNNFSDFLEKTGGGLHHIAFLTDDIAKELKTLKAQGRKLQNEEPRGIPGAQIAFIDPSAADNMLIELVQRD
jgi:methylmalonyl-CoA/ethylmalonyl-CoA epimerase